MRPNDTYIADLVLAWVFRVGMYGGVLAIMAMTTACSPTLPDPLNLLPKRSAAPGVTQGEDSQTRNYNTPYDGGCNEKSDSSLRKAPA